MFVDTVNRSCSGDSYEELAAVCMTLPENGCHNGTLDEAQRGCREDQYACGDGTCVHGLQLCDYKYDCLGTGADEVGW